MLCLYMVCKEYRGVYLAPLQLRASVRYIRSKDPGQQPESVFKLQCVLGFCSLDVEFRVLEF